MAFKRNLPGCAASGCACAYTVPTIPCGGCNAPASLTLTWQYRSLSDPAGVQCPPDNAGSAVNTIVKPLTYVVSPTGNPNFTGWFSDWFQVSDHDWGCDTYGDSLRIDPSYWVRFQLSCNFGGFGLVYGATQTKDPECSPRLLCSHGCDGGLHASPCGGLGNLGSCTPFHFGGGLGVNISGRNFDRFDITA